MNKFLGIIAAAVVSLGASGFAQAATLTFDTWTDTGSPSSTPIVTVSDAGANTFVVNIAKAAGSTTVGSLISMYFDINGVDTMGVTASGFALSPAASFTTTPTKVAPSAVPSNGNLNGTAYPNDSDWSFAILTDKKDNIGAEHSLSFQLSSINTLVLSDFLKIGLRIQRVGSPSSEPGDRGGSDKLVGFPGSTPPPPAVPLPAGAVLMLTALGGLGVARKRKS